MKIWVDWVNLAVFMFMAFSLTLFVGLIAIKFSFRSFICRVFSKAMAMGMRMRMCAVSFDIVIFLMIDIKIWLVIECLSIMPAMARLVLT